ncbi:uncharacterized protein I206_102207 [Kwoniella pini CBS 10737]|uniref:Zn(2)-C6 fungal-type domain-containing protein n=1 Tax=Kwoniella pini CBS 10737 TaxID=1296096 RepID=A0A1B9HSU6_9TREE|nr:uncharacterized protein I206_07575 [Kwoniella pini CBS 10737]OCF46342.1 hypothetical protein I206_07575 [Kwoniella pini CBS 10737]
MGQSSTPSSPVPSASNNKRSRPNNSTRLRCINACNRCKMKKLKCFRLDETSSDCAGCTKASEPCIFEDTVLRPGYHRYIIALENRVAKLEKALAEIQPDHPDLGDHYNAVPTTSQSAKTQSNPMHTESDHVEGPSQNLKLDTSHTALSGLLQSSTHTPTFTSSYAINLSSVMQPSSSSAFPANPNPVVPSVDIADKLLDTVYFHLQCRYPFLDWDQIRHWHSARHLYLHIDSQTHYKDQVAGFFLWMIYAIGVQLDPMEGLDSALSYFQRAARHLNTVTSPHDLTTAQVLLLITFYAFRSATGPSLWLYGGLAMRLCVELDLYRSNSHAVSSVEDQWKKRIFWSAYTFDRLISHASSRPVSISDDAIDVEMPLDICTSIKDSRIIAAAASSQAIQGSLTNMTSAIMSIKMYRIRSRIHAAMPALKNPAMARDLTIGFLTELEEWRRKIPAPFPTNDIPMQAEDRLRWRYFLCVLLVLRPSILSASPGDPTLGLCATAAAEACELDRTVHKGPSTRQTTISVCHTLLCGTTLLYCLYICPTVINSRVSARAIRACSGTLAVYSQLFDQARPFYDTFEYMADEILSGASEAESQRRVVQVIAAMVGGDFTPLASLYDTLKAKKPDGPILDPDLTTSNTATPAPYSDNKPTSPPQEMPTGLTPFLTGIAAPEQSQSNAAFSNTDDATQMSVNNLDIDWLNLDHALWEYMT